MAEPASELEQLRAENRLLRALLRDVELYGQAFEYRPPGGERMALSPVDVRVVMRHDAATVHEAARKVVAAAEAWRDSLLGRVTSAERLAAFDAACSALRAAVDEWRARHA